MHALLEAISAGRVDLDFRNYLVPRRGGPHAPFMVLAAHRLDQLSARRADLPGADRVAAAHQAGTVRPADTVLPRAGQLVRAAGRRAGAASGRRRSRICQV
uniref:(northern house mosquito) hypothetical protein n=1 Tax=Culex pipiens TaxID=7175 RepID=A0A8D8A3P4_CULPI